MFQDATMQLLPESRQLAKPAKYVSVPNHSNMLYGCFQCFGIYMHLGPIAHTVASCTQQVLRVKTLLGGNTTYVAALFVPS